MEAFERSLDPAFSPGCKIHESHNKEDNCMGLIS